MIFYTCVLVLTIWVLWSRWKSRKLIKFGKQFSTKLPSVPLFGHSYKFIGNDEVQMKALQYFGRESIENGGITTFWMGPNLFASITDPITIEYCMKTYMRKSAILRFLREFLGNGTIFAPVKIWRTRRKILAPTFGPKQLVNFVQFFAKQSSIMADALEEKVGTGPFPLWLYMTSYAMDAVCETTMGIQNGAQKKRDHKFLETFDICTKLLASRILCPWLHIDSLYRRLPAYQVLLNGKEYIDKLLNSIIKMKKKERENKKLSTNDDVQDTTDVKTFLDLLSVPTKSIQLSDMEIKEEILVLLSAGTDTSAVGSSFTAVMLSRHPDIQEKIYEELKDVFGDSNRLATPEDLHKLKYLEAVIKETLRLYPPVPVIVRDSDRDTILPSGDLMVKGCTIMINIWATHRNPKYWGEDAEVYRPERFLEGPLMHPSQFIPFSCGPRNCLGYQYAMLSMKTALSTMLRRYRLLPATPDSSSTPIRLKFDIMMKDVDYFPVRLESRI